MNKNLCIYSESLLLSLCKEIEYIGYRSKNINSSLKTCQNKILFKRLVLELEKLNKIRTKIINISEDMFRENSKDLSTEFFLEIIKRSNTFQLI